MLADGLAGSRGQLLAGGGKLIAQPVTLSAQSISSSTLSTLAFDLFISGFLLLLGGRAVFGFPRRTRDVVGLPLQLFGRVPLALHFARAAGVAAGFGLGLEAVHARPQGQDQAERRQQCHD